MTAPPSTRGRATYERILEAACDLFYRQGVAATALSQIIEVSETGKGQLYHFFDSKDDLVMAVIERQIGRVLASQQPALDRLSTAVHLHQWADQVVASYALGDYPVRCPLGALVSETSHSDPAARAALEVGFSRWRDLLADGLRRIHRDPPLPPDGSAERRAELLLTAYQGGILLSDVRGNLGPLRLALATAVENVLKPAGSGLPSM